MLRSARPGRPATHGAPALRRGRDRVEPRAPGGGRRRRRSARRLPGDRRLRGDARGRRGAASCGGTRVLRDAGRDSRSRARARRWARDRYRGPYLRDALLDAGALVETLETVTFWSRVPALYEAVSSALRESLTAQGHAAGDPLPRLARVSGRARRCTSPSRARRPRTRSPSGARPRRRRATRSWPPAARSPTTTGSAPTTATGTRGRSGRSASRCCGRSRRRSTPAGVMNPGVLVPPDEAHARAYRYARRPATRAQAIRSNSHLERCRSG